jgi:hypothetical protein
MPSIETLSYCTLHKGKAVCLADQFVPDVILMDLEIPGGIDGVEATRKVMPSGSKTSALATSSRGCPVTCSITSWRYKNPTPNYKKSEPGLKIMLLFSGIRLSVSPGLWEARCRSVIFSWYADGGSQCSDLAENIHPEQYDQAARY